MQTRRLCNELKGCCGRLKVDLRIAAACQMTRVLPLALIFFATAALAASHETQRVVVIYDERTDLPGLAAFDKTLVRALAAGSPKPVEIYREEMDLSRVGSDAYLPRLRDHLRAKYADKKIDVAIAVMGPSLDFLLRHGDVVFPAVPIVFGGLDDRELRGQPLPSHVTGVLLKRAFVPTLELALTLHPDTERIVFVGGASEFDARLVNEARAQLRPFEARFEFSYLTALPIRELLKELSKLPAHSIVLYSTLLRDVAGEAFVPHEVAARISAAANAPVYGFLDQYLGHGIVGGRLYSLNSHGEEAARLTLQILAGKAPSDLSPVVIGAGETMLDWRQLQRWDISERRLPPGAIVRFRPSSLWSQYKGYVIGAASVVVFQALLISGLLMQLTRRRRAELALGESEQRMSLAAEAFGLGVWSCNLTTAEIWATRECRTLFGWPPEVAITGAALMDRIHPQERQTVRNTLDRVLVEGGNLELEARIVLPGGNVRWIVARGRVIDGPHKQPRQMIGVCVDVTSRKTSELTAKQHLNELAHVTRVSTMGELGASLSHELNQPLTAILSNAQAAQRFMAAQPPNIAEVCEILKDIVDDNRRAGEVIRRMRSLVKKGESEFMSVDLGALMSDVAKLVRADAILRNVRVALQCDPRVPRGSCDSIQLQQVMLNLLVNAFDAMSEIPVSEREVVMRVDGDDADTVKVMVSDRGSGLSPDTLSQMFNPFYTTKKNGLGMGLAISQSIIEAHGGRLWAENKPDCGAAFYFTLPVSGVRPGARSQA